MSDPVLAITLTVTLALVISAARYFRSLDSGFSGDSARTMAVGLAAGGFALLPPLSGLAHALLIAALIVVSALYLRHVGRESEPAEGMLDGALLGTAAALPLAFGSGEVLLSAAACVLAGSVAGYGITTATFHVREKGRQLAVDAMTAAAAALAGCLPIVVHRTAALPARTIAIAAAVAVPVTTIASVFLQSRTVRSELEEESALGFLDATDADRTAHPFRRFAKGAWVDGGAHREFVRTAWKIALRKKQQRSRPDSVARLYQLEIIKLRMHLQEMRRIGRGGAAGEETTGDDAAVG